MNDLVERLRDERNFDWNTSELEDRIALARSAADEIVRLEAELQDAQANAVDWQRVAMRHIGPVKAVSTPSPE